VNWTNGMKRPLGDDSITQDERVALARWYGDEAEDWAWVFVTGGEDAAKELRILSGPAGRGYEASQRGARVAARAITARAERFRAGGAR
jgi:hypothetical protein